MILCDASPLIALTNTKDEKHSLCVEVLSLLPSPLVTTVYCFSEAMYFAGRNGGWYGQEPVWRLWRDERLVIRPYQEQEFLRMQGLMKKYQDVPMDLADASLVVAAEDLGQNRIFTLDKDFYIYRLHGRDPFEVVPELRKS